MDTSVLHLIGALTGLAPAILLPRTGQIYLGDWEGLLSLPFRVKMVGAPEGEPERPEPEPEPVALTSGEREACSRADVFRAIAGFDYLGACAAQKPRLALRLIGSLDPGDLDDRDQRRLEGIVKVARRQIEEGVLEIRGISSLPALPAE